MEQVKLNLGCGIRNFGSDWDHIDMEKHSHVKSHSITILPYEDSSVDVVYASHVLEYFDRQEVAQVLKEWRRVLKKGGVLRLAVPNFKVLSQLLSKKVLTLLL